MDQSKIEALAKELAKDLKTPEDLSQFSAILKKVTVEAALSAEMDDHLGYEPHSSAGYNTGNSRNGKSRKRLKGDNGDCEIAVPRDRSGTFEPQLVKKYQTRVTGMDDQILSLYAKGLSTRDIVATFKEMYDVDTSPALISKVTDAVYEVILEWQNRPLHPVPLTKLPFSPIIKITVRLP